MNAPTAPVRAEGVEFLGEVPGSGYRTSPALIRRCDGQTIQLTPLLYLVLRAVDGRRGYADIAADVSERSGRLVSTEDVRELVESRLRPLGVLRQQDGTEPGVRKVEPLLGLRCRFVVTDPRITERITTPFARLFHPVVVVAVVLAFTAVSYWILFDKGLASATYQAFDEPLLLLAVLGVTAASAGFHEFGHAAATTRAGATPGAMGAGLYLVWPAFYTDVSDSYRLGRAGRLLVDLGGLYFNAITALAMFCAWWVTGWDAVLLLVATQLLQMVRQLTPLVRFDGYHVLADLTGVPDLYNRIRPTLLGLLPHRWGAAESAVLKPWARAVVTAWVLLAVPLLVLSSVLAVVALPRIVATGWASVGRQWDGLHANADIGNVAGVLVRMVSIAAVLLPLLGIGYVLVRLARRLLRGAWRVTDGRPAQRAVALAAMAAVLAALGWAWWPGGDTYRPIQPGDRGTVQDVAAPIVSAAEPRPAPISESPAPAGASGGSRRMGILPADTTPLASHKQALALVLVPRPGTSAPTWVFPFDRPRAPGDGDNQALAANLIDGSTRYEVAFALVWVTGDTAGNRNEAYALASCRRCTTVAVAFQVVLVLGEANVAPENLAVAVNYNCARCVTVALARQLVVTLPGLPSASAQAALTELWAQVEALGRRIGEIPLNQVQDELTRLETAISEVVRQDSGPPVTAPDSAVEPPSGTTGPTTTEPAPPTSSQPVSPGPTTEPGTPTTSQPVPTTTPTEG